MEVDKLMIRLAEILRTISEPHLRNLAECFLMDEAAGQVQPGAGGDQDITTPIAAACWSTW